MPPPGAWIFIRAGVATTCCLRNEQPHLNTQVQANANGGCEFIWAASSEWLAQMAAPARLLAREPPG
jgi:hypothetical protein